MPPRPEVGDEVVVSAFASDTFQVRFRLLVFRPFVGEILSGRVSSCTKDGIKVGVGSLAPAFSKCTRAPRRYSP